MKTAKAKATLTRTVKSNTSAYRDGTIWSCKKYFPVKIVNGHPGDVVSLRLGYQTYSFTLPSYTTSSHTHTFYTSCTIGNYTSATITVKNTYGQTLCTKYDSWTWN